MKKHIIGLAIFSFIVSTAAIVYGLFNIPQIIPVPAPQYNSTNAPTSCWKMKRDRKELRTNLIEVKQSTINLKTEELNWEIVAPEINTPIALYFFSKDINGTHYLASSPVITEFSRIGKLKINKTFKFLYEPKSYENLYVIARFVSDSEIYNQNNPPKFDAAEATAVTVDYGK